MRNCSYGDLNEFSFCELAALQSFIWSKNCFFFYGLCVPVIAARTNLFSTELLEIAMLIHSRQLTRQDVLILGIYSDAF
jgi:hypothetical protein